MINIETYQVRLRGLSRTRHFIAFSQDDAALQWAYSMPAATWATGEAVEIDVIGPDGVVAPLSVTAHLEFTTQ